MPAAPTHSVSRLVEMAPRRPGAHAPLPCHALNWQVFWCNLQRAQSTCHPYTFARAPDHSIAGAIPLQRHQDRLPFVIVLHGSGNVRGMQLAGVSLKMLGLGCLLKNCVAERRP